MVGSGNTLDDTVLHPGSKMFRDLVADYCRDGAKNVNYYGGEMAVLKHGSQWTYATYNPHHGNWLAGDAYARTPEDAVRYATSDSIPTFGTMSAVLEHLQFFDWISENYPEYMKPDGSERRCSCKKR